MSISWTIETHDSVNSTQDIIKGLGTIGEPEGMVVQALEQTGGHGRHGRQWISEKGNLYVSILLRPSCPATEIGQLSLMCGLAAARAVQPFLNDPSKLMLKWPNDLLIAGEKSAGILLETGLSGSSIDWLAIGIGINVKSAPSGLGTFLNGYTKKPLELERLRHELLKNLGDLYMRWNREGGSEIRKEWLALTCKRGTPVKVKVGAQIEQGSFYDVDDQGALLLHDKELRVRKVTAGEVYI